MFFSFRVFGVFRGLLTRCDSNVAAAMRCISDDCPELQYKQQKLIPHDNFEMLGFSMRYPTHLIALLLMFGLFSPGRAEDAFIPYLATEDVVYGHKDGMALTLDVIEPNSDRNGLGLILVSSGSWISRKSDNLEEEEKRRKYDHWMQGLIKGGFTLFVVRHGSSPKYFVPEMTPDILRSIRFVRTNAERFHVDPLHLGITSGSSGGHLSLMAATHGDDGNPQAKDPIDRVSSRTQAVVAWFPPTDMVNWGAPKSFGLLAVAKPGLFERILGEIKDLEPQLKEISPIYFVSKDSPPLLLLHGDADKTVPLQQSTIMKTKYEELGRPVKLIVQPGGGHSSWTGIMDQYPIVWDWFQTHLK